MKKSKEVLGYLKAHKDFSVVEGELVLPSTEFDRFAAGPYTLTTRVYADGDFWTRVQAGEFLRERDCLV